MSGAYYNEHDPKAAAWLRELIQRNLICVGEVDERSIEVVQPDELRGFAQCHFFAGIGVWSYALRRAGWADDRPVWTGSCPCQPFSAAGKGEGVDDERHLWPHLYRLIRECRPDVCFGEQVASKAGRSWLDIVSTDLEGVDYAVGAADLCAAGAGAPHIRQRLWWVAGLRMDHSLRDGRAAQRHDHPLDVRQLADSTSDAVGTVADAAGRRLDEGGFGGAQSEAVGSRERQFGADDSRELGDSARGGCGERGDASLAWSSGHSDGAGITGVVGDAERPGLEGHAGNGHDSNESGRIGADATRPVAATSTARGMADDDGNRCRIIRPPLDNRRSVTLRNDSDRCGPVNGFWGGADWIPCTDGKARPVEPGSFPLAHGAPARVGRLRGYGNAIVAEVAREFIEAYLDVRGG